VLRFLAPLLLQGSILLFHDWNAFILREHSPAGASPGREQHRLF
jgi:hypothetical protein